MDNGFPILGDCRLHHHHHHLDHQHLDQHDDEPFADDYSDDQAFRQLESLLDDASNQLPVIA